MNGNDALPVRYEREILPSFYDALEKGLNVYHFESPQNPINGTYGANPKNEGNILRDIRKNDSIVFKVGKKRRKELGNKGVEYDGELERVVERVERKGDTVYLYFKR